MFVIVLSLLFRGLPVGHGRGDIAVVESGVPRKQDNASVSKHAVQKELKEKQTTGINRDYVTEWFKRLQGKWDYTLQTRYLKCATEKTL